MHCIPEQVKLGLRTQWLTAVRRCIALTGPWQAEGQDVTDTVAAILLEQLGFSVADRFVTSTFYSSLSPLLPDFQ